MADVMSVLDSGLNEEQISFVCREALKGLQYVSLCLSLFVSLIGTEQWHADTCILYIRFTVISKGAISC